MVCGRKPPTTKRFEQRLGSSKITLADCFWSLGVKPQSIRDIFLQWSIWVEVSRREKKVEEANQAHEESSLRFFAGRERMLLFSSLKHCLRAWSQLVFESHVETVRHEQDQKHREELNGVWKEFRAEQAKELRISDWTFIQSEIKAAQVVQSIYEEKIAKLTTQFEDDAAELMHVQSLKIYSLKMALAEVNEKHEDELAELVHAQGLTKHRLRSLMQERFLTGVIRQELQRHFLAWSEPHESSCPFVSFCLCFRSVFFFVFLM
eukprot:g19428.t1